MGFLSNVDWDDIFSYQTVKIVKIRDKRLSTILLEKRYLATDSPIGSIRSSLLAPTYRDPSPPYCNTSGNAEYNGFPTFQCQYWDEVLALYPSSSDTSMFITTRATTEQQDTLNNCNLTEPSCVYVTSNVVDLYVADIDNFTIMIDHTVSAPNLDIEYNARELNGRLLGSNGKVWTPPPPSVVGVKNKYDILTLDACLEAAGIDSLDQPSLSNASRSMRNDGVLILVFITYSNMYTYDTSNFRYTYEFKVIKDTKFKAIEPIFTTGVNNRFVFDRHGVKLIFIQTGTIGKFDFQTMLLTFVSGIGLVTVSTVIVDVLAVKLLPQKHKYQKLKYQEVGVSLPLLANENETADAEHKN
ncbi:putative purinergic receptor [Heterostelium album PN500]|uniref:Putative purinergic receptor n=1 Tax=Heterostelium pallidum (strain ATCC 26659 / Pp 5 / PN500) TaxID=670386 RepID=D3BBU9_HETP5|nr:putative purinergic receptor [Heterostelium album PN500]EFA81132.1 putative purinergic receptor [Heterostelium album PN500]|eukprot:XP_020433250.1 putative purinergic receptor [Heterostelium album PN500]